MPRDLDGLAIGRVGEVDIDCDDGLGRGPQHHRRRAHEPDPESERHQGGPARRERPAGAELVGDTDRRGLAETQRHHKADARAIEDELVRPECRSPQEAHQDPRGKKDADLHPPQPTDRQAETKNVRHLDPARGQRTARDVQTREAGHDPGAQRQTRQHQPLIDGTCIAAAHDAEGRCPEMAKDQHPVQHCIARNADQQHCHHRTRMR